MHNMDFQFIKKQSIQIQSSAQIAHEYTNLQEKKIKLFESNEEEGEITSEKEESDNYEGDFIDDRSEDELTIYSDSLPDDIL